MEFRGIGFCAVEVMAIGCDISAVQKEEDLVMSRAGKFLVSFSALLLLTLLSFQTAFASSGVILEKETRGDMVSQLQKDLKAKGFMSINPTGYFGETTENAVISFQKKYGLQVDGIAGKQTLDKLDSLMGRKTTVYRGTTTRPSQKVIDFAKKFLGLRYRWGGTTTKGFDCSGFVKYVFKNFGITLNRTSSMQAKNGTYIKKANLQTGDIVFFDTNGGNNRINHVGIYIGGGKFIHSSSSHSGVTISSLSSGFYSRSYMTARRVLK